MSGDVYHVNGGGYRRMDNLSGSSSSLSRSLTSLPLLLLLGILLVLFVYIYSSYPNEERLLPEELPQGGDELRKLKDKLLDVHTRLDEEAKRNSDYSVEKSGLEKENKELSAKTSTLQRSINELEEKLRNSISEVKRLEARLVDADKNAKQAEQKLANLTATLNAQETQLADLHKIVDSMKQAQAQQEQAPKHAIPLATEEAVVKGATGPSGKAVTGGDGQVAGGRSKPATADSMSKDEGVGGGVEEEVVTPKLEQPGKGGQNKNLLDNKISAVKRVSSPAPAEIVMPLPIGVAAVNKGVKVPSEKRPLQREKKDKKKEESGGTKPKAAGGETTGEVKSELEKDT